MKKTRIVHINVVNPRAIPAVRKKKKEDLQYWHLSDNAIKKMNILKAKAFCQAVGFVSNCHTVAYRSFDFATFNSLCFCDFLGIAISILLLF